MKRVVMAVLAASLASPAMSGAAWAQDASRQAQQQSDEEFRREQQKDLLNRQPPTAAPQNRSDAMTRAGMLEADRAPDLSQQGAPADNIRGGAHLPRPPGTGPQAGGPEATPLLQQGIR